MDKPVVGVATKAQIVDHYAQILTKVMGNEKDVQMCIYHVSWKTNNWLCVPGVLSVQPDNNFEFQNKDYEEFSFGDSWEERRSKPLSDFDPNFTMYSRKWLRYLKYLTKKYLKKHNIQIQIWELQCFSITGGVSGNYYVKFSFRKVIHIVHYVGCGAVATLLGSLSNLFGFSCPIGSACGFSPFGSYDWRWIAAVTVAVFGGLIPFPGGSVRLGFIEKLDL
ncbi:RNA recognition motif [Trifolium repens]|nr:RNA recognition motif [Trifolium repens]